MYSNVDLQMKRRRGPNEGGSPTMGAMPSVTSPIHVVGNPMTKPRSPIQVNSKRVSPDEEEITSYLNPLLEMLLNCMDIQENSLAAQQGGRPPSLTTSSPNNTNGMSRSFENLHDAAAADPFQRDKKRKPPPPPLSVSGGSLPTRNPPAFNFDDGLEEKTSDAKPSGAARRQLSPKLKGPPPLPPTSSGSNISPPSSQNLDPSAPTRPPRKATVAGPSPLTSSAPSSPSPNQTSPRTNTPSPSIPLRPPRGAQQPTTPPPPATSPVTSPVTGKAGIVPIRPARPSREDTTVTTPTKSNQTGAPPVPLRAHKNT